ncbi:bifunctional helix-turn-helix transcriptional regulator/GNAT family N-acetyltransferase [Bartonella sp. HY329]|uniref:bifunctional helix-turn-helix transcriptional regulator/GNAT family N-acetyltransferase n=1 Tax=unclassified Bartonella TaxID=2645622 RepID=UPI0021C5712D|nr:MULTISPECIES: bifunctional helix-turn-helix transcriptional regulator/GNAT family N-acetyltransferase [unclassified Bartonella]UXM94391.1 bifunctional helix-turn-helix transcriptional regulator/GNAT family N-acetyltransferase [Bartonella sp. HY329]UXN08714.1 bifunctional helix-turn-helix transcriptional regulator/GNAT family N-acetyltransferase [Bartonella sp. HY328]
MQTQETELFRTSLREMVRELGMLSRKTIGTDISPLQSHILIELNSSQLGLSVTELAKTLCVEKSSISRTLKTLEKDRLLLRKINPSDARSMTFTLTEKGKNVLFEINRYANQFISDALTLSSAGELQKLSLTIKNFLKTLKNARKQRDIGLKIRPIEPKDNDGLAAVIRQSFIDNKIDHLEGVSLNDPCLNHLSDVYTIKGSGYWVIEMDGTIKGGVGIAPLLGAGKEYCELQKLYIDSSLTGLGVGRRLISLAIDKATEYGYSFCYLETLDELGAALILYESFDFKLLDKRVGDTGHNSCGIYMLKALNTVN